MTVPTFRSREDYTGNGATTSYPYQFRIYKATDLVVTRATPDGVETPLVLNTDYTVSGIGKYAGGNVVLTTVLPTGYRLAIERALPVTQETDLRNQGAYFAETHEDVFDRTIMLLQRFASYLGFGPDGSARTLLLGKTDIDGSGSFRARQNRIQDLADPVNDQDAANKRWSLDALRMFSLDNNAITTNGTLTPASQDDAVPAATGGGNVSLTMNAMAQALLNKVQYVRDAYLTRAAAQTQSVTAFTSGGAAPSFTLTPSPAITAYAANQRFRCKFHAAGTTGSNTLNVSGLGAKNLKQYDSAGAKVPAVVTTGQLADVEYDGVDFVVVDPLPPVIVPPPYLGGYQEFTASGNFTVPDGVAAVWLTGIAGGGGGGPSANSASVNGGGGGGHGAIAVRKKVAVTPGQVIAVTIGAAGASGASGGATSFGALLSLAGGGGGSNVATSSGGGAGFPGGFSTGVVGSNSSGAGASTPFGSGGAAKAYAASTAQAGNAAAANSGAGGGGAINAASLAAQSGGTGGTGYLMVEW